MACLKCAFWLTNETINIWSHVFGWMLFFGLTIYDLFLLNIHASQFDKLVVGLLLGCFQISMASSTMYHTFSCKSEKHFNCFLSFDLFGIALSLLGIYLSGIYYAFWCHPVHRMFYLSTVFFIFVIVIGIVISKIKTKCMILFFCFSGKLDYIGSSHQWWHFLVVIALYYWHNTGILYIEYRMNHGCVNDLRL
ncbi:PREDICTED: progestin and adipoQ receptor family member 3 [Diuraphis noxia]|uniref:progestin and adipoQ receptor family member 3 n=1 Tax=Diuraphis noxia TaxID=143948 RepID=UPI0007635BA3|nr:PREDICTED: progestin and adipoQ receptor family member 3 [Diuraphis noxia]